MCLHTSVRPAGTKQVTEPNETRKAPLKSFYILVSSGILLAWRHHRVRRSELATGDVVVVLVVASAYLLWRTVLRLAISTIRREGHSTFKLTRPFVRFFSSPGDRCTVVPPACVCVPLPRSLPGVPFSPPPLPTPPLTHFVATTPAFVVPDECLSSLLTPAQRLPRAPLSLLRGPITRSRVNKSLQVMAGLVHRLAFVLRLFAVNESTRG